MHIYKKGKSERIDYGGVTFFRYPDSNQRNNRVYFNPSKADRAEGIDSLHREIYKDHHGAIPDGCDIHHVDGNTLNNAVENLQPLSRSAHAKEHVSDEHHARLREAGRERLRAYQSKHVKWRTETEEGRAWAAANAAPLVAAKAEKRGFHRIICMVCGASADRPGQADGSPPLYCSEKCNQTAFRRRAGIGSEAHQFACETCGKVGVTTRKKRRYCDRKCKSLGRKTK